LNANIAKEILQVKNLYNIPFLGVMTQIY